MTRILIADDNPQNLYLLETVLKSHGHEVVSARNGIEAIELAVKNPPDLIVTDILMPGMDGFELCRRWRAHELLNQIPFVFYTATYTDLKDEQFALSLGADRFLIKPQQPEVLIQVVEEVLAKPRKTRQASRKKSPENETKVLQKYNEVLFRKLEKKVKQLEEVIEKQQKAETELRESEQKYRTLITQSPDGIFVVNLQGNFLAVNRIMYESLKYSEAELLSMSIWDIVPEQYVDQHKKRMVDIVTGKAPNEAAEYMVRGKDGELYCVEILSAPYYEGEKLVGFQGIARDITGRKQAEKALMESEAQYRLLAEHTTDTVWLMDMNLKTTYQSPSAEKLRGYTPREILDLPLEKHLAPESLKLAFEVLAEEIPKVKTDPDYNPIHTLDLELYCKDGTTVWAESKFSVIRDPGGKAVSILAEARDITDRRRAEKALQESEEKYRNLFDNASEAIFVAEAGNIVFLNPRTSSMIGYSGDELLNRSFIEFIHPDERELVIDRHVKRLQGVALPSRYEFRIIHKTGTTIWVELNTVIISWEGKPATLNFLTDVTDRKLAAEKLAKSHESLQKTLNDAINTMVRIVELRDPYTAGHQQRVADLASAIAVKMKLEDTRISQLKMAAVIHDIGKMYVPSDILSKPGRLSDVEFGLIRTHAQGGYDIVKSMDFPCNVAKTVLQHHERLDGSGYPNHLKGEDTLLEAKILAVADVIEAMASHRPYRSSLGIDKALEEISRNKGKLYDPDVVDTCLELFNRDKFEFKTV